MPETKQNFPSVKHEQPTLTPPPDSFPPDDLLPSEPSFEDGVDALVAQEEAAEAWILLAPRHALRASDFREIEEIQPASLSQVDENGQPYEATWPIPGLLVNGRPLTTPDWTFEQLLQVIGAAVKNPTERRSWTRGKNLPKTT